MADRKPKLPAPDMSKVKLSVGGADASRLHRRGERERDKVQKAFDSLIAQAYGKWDKAGKPDKFADSPLGHVTTVESEVESVKSYLRRAATHYGYSLRFGTTEETADGGLDLAFVAKDPPVRDADDTED